MPQAILVLVVLLVLLVLTNLVMLWRRGLGVTEVTATADTADFERRMRDEFERARTSRDTSSRDLREEVAKSLAQTSEALVGTMKALRKFIEISEKHTPFLLRKAQRIEEYLDQR